MEGLVGFAVCLGEFATIPSYFFNYDCPERVSATIGAFCFAARMIISSSESGSEGTSVFASREEAHTTLQGEDFALPWTFCW